MPEVKTTDTVRLPPHSTEAEQGLLGSLLIDNRVFDMVNDVVTPEFKKAGNKLVLFAPAPAAPDLPFFAQV